MARASRGSDLRPLGEAIMEAVSDDLADTRLPVGVGLGVGGQLAQEAESPTGRRAPRTPARAGVLAFTPPWAGEGVQDPQEEVVQASAVTEPRAAGAEQDEEEIEIPGREEVDLS